MSTATGLTRSELLVLYDVDGTLTPHRRPIRPEVLDLLVGQVLPRATVGLVSGSDLGKLSWQMGGPEVIRKFDYVFSENGLVAHAGKELLGEQSIVTSLGEEKVQRLINFALKYMSGIELPCGKRGNFVEFRTGLINLSPVGRSCSQEQRNRFAELDKRDGIRRSFREALLREFPPEEEGLQFAIGGQISIDVFPTGWDKRFCLSYVEDRGFKEIHFFGDRTEEGGNDHDIYADERTVGHAVTSPDDTVRMTKQLLGL